MVRRGLAAVLGGALCLFSAAGAMGQGDEGRRVSAEILVGPIDSGVRQAGLALSVADGWKTYWRAPGEAGVPPVLDFSRSGNVRAVRVAWPVPEVFENFGYRSAGYAGTVVLPLEIEVEDPARPVALRLDLQLGVCRDICLLEETTLARSIPHDAAAADAGRIARAVAAVPDDAAVEAATCRIEGTGADRAFRARLRFDRELDGNPFVAMEAGRDSWFTDTEIRAKGRELEIDATLALADAGAWIDRSAIWIGVIDSAVAAHLEGCAAAG